MTGPSARKTRALAVAALIVMLGATAVAVRMRLQRRSVMPQTAQLTEVARIVGGAARPGDGVAWQPSWSADQRWRVGQALAEAGLDVDRALIHADPLDELDIDGLRRLWVVSTHGQRRALDGAEMGLELVNHHDLGFGTAVDLYEVPTSETVLDLRRDLGMAVVERDGPDGVWKKCTYRGNYHACGGPWWQDVRAGLHEVGHTRRRCLFVQPHRDGGTLRMTLAQPPMANRLVGRLGNTLWAVRNDAGSSLTMRVYAAEQRLVELTLPRDDFGWHPFEVDLPASASGRALRVEVTAADAAWRQACLDLRLERHGATAQGLGPAQAQSPPQGGLGGER